MCILNKWRPKSYRESASVVWSLGKGEENDSGLSLALPLIVWYGIQDVKMLEAFSASETKIIII